MVYDKLILTEKMIDLALQLGKSQNLWHSCMCSDVSYTSGLAISTQLIVQGYFTRVKKGREIEFTVTEKGEKFIKKLEAIAEEMRTWNRNGKKQHQAK